MPFATLDEAWGDIKPYMNYNPILNQNNTNMDPEPKKVETIRVAEPEPVPQNNLQLNNIEKVNIDLKNEVIKLNKKIEQLINNNNRTIVNNNNDFLTKNMNDILLFMIFGLFVMLLLDLFHKVLRK